MDQESFKDYLSKWSISPNLSNQNFHNKLIHALSLSFDVDVVSVRAINKNYAVSKLEKSQKEENNIKWLYPEVSASRVAKILCLSNRINKVLSIDNNKTVIFVDALNYSLVKEAYRLAKKHHYPVIGVCTDNPYNISFTSAFYNKSLMKYATKLDGYIVLTESINKVFNLGNKPYIQIDGVSEEFKSSSKPLAEGKYIYFGGSLMEEYGVYNLIEAYKQLELKDIRLVICGHHLNKEKMDAAIKEYKDIVFMGPVSYEDNLNLLFNAVLSVNPRPINQKIDDYSLPSKTLESLSVKCLNVTVDNRLLKDNYKEEIVWSKSAEVNDLKEAIRKALSLSEKESLSIKESGYKKVMLRTSQLNISKLIKEYLLKFFLN